MTTIAGLFEGYGGLTAAARAVFGGELAWVSEYEPPSKATPRPTQAAARLLAHRHPDVRNLGDITAIDWPSVEPVDVLCGGFPCQDVSSAGKRVGMKPDSRSGLWTHFARAIAVLRPSIVLIENVRGLLSAEAACDLESDPWGLGDEPDRPLRALGAVLGDLATLGFDAEWTSVLASDVGAPHERWRVFVLAWPVGADPAELGRRTEGRNDWLRAAGLVASSADTHGSSWEGSGPQGRPDPDRGRRLLAGPADSGRARVADADGEGSQGAEPAAGFDLPARSTAADASGERRGEGRSEPAWVERRPDAALGGEFVAAHADGRQHPEVEAGADAVVGERPAFGRGPVEHARAGRGHDTAQRGTPAEPATDRGAGAVGEGDGGAAAPDPDGAGVRHEPGRVGRSGGPGTRVARDDGAHGGPAPDPERDGRSGRDQGAPGETDELGPGSRPSATRRGSDAREWGDYADAIGRWERVLGRPAPPPTQLSANYRKMVARRRAGKDGRPVGHRGTLRASKQLSPVFVEWMMGLNEGWVTDVPGLTRNEQLKLLGNGVVPQQAIHALRLLLAQAAATSAGAA